MRSRFTGLDNFAMGRDAELLSFPFSNRAGTEIARRLDNNFLATKVKSCHPVSYWAGQSGYATRSFESVVD
jgi:hypothetical protein